MIEFIASPGALEMAEKKFDRVISEVRQLDAEVRELAASRPDMAGKEIITGLIAYVGVAVEERHEMDEEFRTYRRCAVKFDYSSWDRLDPRGIVDQLSETLQAIENGEREPPDELVGAEDELKPEHTRYRAYAPEGVTPGAALDDAFKSAFGDRDVAARPFDNPAAHALSDVWASIDGKLEEFRAGKPGDAAGYHDGYLIEANEAIQRLEARGFVIVPKGPPSSEVDWGKPEGSEVW